MKTANAQLNTFRRSPRKVRLLADLVRGKGVTQAISTLQFANKRGNSAIVKLIESAVANAKNMGLNTDALIVKDITVNGGAILYRSMPMSRGRAFRIKKRTSHIAVSLAEGEVKAKKARFSKSKAAKAESTEASAEHNAENK